MAGTLIDLSHAIVAGMTITHAKSNRKTTSESAKRKHLRKVGDHDSDVPPPPPRADPAHDRRTRPIIRKIAVFPAPVPARQMIESSVDEKIDT